MLGELIIRLVKSQRGRCWVGGKKLDQNAFASKLDIVSY